MAFICTGYTFHKAGTGSGQWEKNIKLKEYLDGQVWSLEPGVDSAARTPKTLRVHMYMLAKRMGCKIRTNAVDGKLIVQKID